MRTLFGALLSIVIICFVWMSLLGLRFVDMAGKKFSIMDLELPGTKARLDQLIQAMSPDAKAAVHQHLSVDYIFMACVYFGIAIFCLMGKKRIREMNQYKGLSGKEREGIYWKKVLTWLGFLQLIPWAFDICENARLAKWIDQGYAGNMIFFEPMVYLKFGIALAAFFTAGGLLLLTAKRHKKLKQAWKKG